MTGLRIYFTSHSEWQASRPFLFLLNMKETGGSVTPPGPSTDPELVFGPSLVLFLGDQEAYPGPPFLGMINSADNRWQPFGHCWAHNTAEEGTLAILRGTRPLSQCPHQAQPDCHFRKCSFGDFLLFKHHPGNLKGPTLIVSLMIF